MGAGGNIIEVEGDEEQLGLLREGKVDMMAQSDIGTAKLMEIHGMDPCQYEMVRVLAKMNLYLLLNKRADPVLVSQMQAAFNDLEKSWLQAIYKKHMSKKHLRILGQ